MITWNHKTQNASLHMIDIFDSIDVQVSIILPNERRAPVAQ